MGVYTKRKSGYAASGAYKRARPAMRPYRPATMTVTAPRGTFKRSSNRRTGGFLGIEYKFYDTSRAGIAVPVQASWAGCELDPTTVNCISAPAEGNGQSDRDGRKIKLTGCHVSGTISCVGATVSTDISPTVVVALVLDTQTNGAQLNSEDVYINPSATANTIPCPLRNLEYSKRFKVLGYKVISMPTITGANTTQFGVSVPWRIDCKLNLPVQFNNTTAGVASVTDNSLHIVANTDYNSWAPLLNYNARVRFVG
jgi:hypothetical protein